MIEHTRKESVGFGGFRSWLEIIPQKTSQKAKNSWPLIREIRQIVLIMQILNYKFLESNSMLWHKKGIH